MSDVQARPGELNSFHSNQTSSATNLETNRDTLDNAFVAFRNAPGGGCAAQGDSVVGIAMTQLLAELREIPAWAKLVHDSLLAADHPDDAGLVSVDAATFNSMFGRLALERGVNVSDLAGSAQITVTPPQVGVVPQDSGYVNDPVCTATGHLLVDSHDFAMPARLEVLSFRRTYASRSICRGAFGLGWWTWTECHAELGDDGTFRYFGPDAFEFTVAGSAGSVALYRTDLDVRVELPDAATQVLHWGRQSRAANQRWTFTDGRLVEVAGPFIGATAFRYGARGRLVELVHDSGRSLALHWNHGRVVEIVASDGRRSTFEYNRAGAMVAVVNARSPESYEVDADGRITSITDADGVRTVAMVYDDEGRVIEQTSATGFTTRFGYDEVRRTTLSDPDYNPLSVYTHDDRGRVEMYATAGGFRFTRRFDELGRVVSQRDPGGRSFTLVDLTAGDHRSEEVRWSSGEVERFDYDRQDRLVFQSSPAASTRFHYDGDSMFPSRIEVAGDRGLAVDLDWAYGSPTRVRDSDGVVDVLTVRPDGTISSATNGVGDTTRYDVDASGAVAAVHHPDGRVVRYERDDAGRLVAVVNAAGARATIRYSAAGRLQSCVDHNGAVTSLEYDAAGLPVRLVAADGVATDFLFDAKQRLIGARFANGDAIGLDLDEFGRTVAIDVNDDRWVTARDASGRIVSRSAPTGEQVAQQYGELGGWMQITDAAGQQWRVERDLVRRVRTLTSPSGARLSETFTAEGLLESQNTTDGGVEHYRYTPAGRLAEVSDGNTFLQYRYDAAGRVVGTNSGTGWWTFDYDSRGCISRRLSPAGREQRYRYNVLDQLTELEVAGETWRFEYDMAGRVTRSIDPTGCESRFAYDIAGRLVESADSLGTAIRYGYDVRGRIAEMVDDHGGSVRYEHNAQNLLTSLTDQLGRRTTVTYDAAGRHVATTFDGLRPAAAPVQSRPELGVESLGPVAFADGFRPLATTTSADGTMTSWTLPGGRRIELVRDADLLTRRLTSPGFTRTWSRDECGRVAQVVDEREGTISTTSFRRDAAGRVVRQDADGDVTEYRYDAAGQLVAMSSAAGDSTWTYDELGRLVGERTPDGERTFRYDAAHQLVELIDYSGTTTFEYDARGRRVHACGQREVVYVWGERVLDAVVIDGEWHRFDTETTGALRRAGGSTIDWTASDGIARPGAIDGDHVVTIDATTFATVSADGAVDWRPFKLADAWGDHAGGSTGEASWHPYFGLAMDGLVWLAARPYDVVTRQFLAPDPLAAAPGRPGSTSPYTYAANDPVNHFDPSGRQPISIEAFNDIRDRRTGVQWQNIATVAIGALAVCVTVATLGTAGPVAMVLGGAAIGAIGGAASGAAREGLEDGLNLGDGAFDGDAVVKDALVGLVAGGAGGGLGAGANALTASTRFAGNGFVQFLGTRGGSMASEGLSGAIDGTLGEVYDVTAPEWMGADGTWNNEQIIVKTVTGAAVGGALHGVGALGHGGTDVPSAAGADPNTVNVVDAPAPDLPDPAPAGPGAPSDAAASTSGASDTGTDASAGGGQHATPATPDTPDTPVVADTPDAGSAPETPDAPDAVDVADAPDAVDVADAPDAVDVVDVPDVPDAVDVVDAPDVPDAVDVVDVPDVPDAVDVVDVPDVPDAVDVVDAPDAGSTPDSVDAPDVPDAVDVVDAPDAPDAADMPDAADTADAADAPDTPDTPDNPDKPDGSAPSSTTTPRTFRSNEFQFTTDADGVTQGAHFTIDESASGLRHGTAELHAQADAAAAGVPTDHGAHVIPHRFTGDQGEINTVPLDAEFNNTAYRTMGNELQAWADNGLQVEGQVDLDIPVGAVRPDALAVTYVVTNPQTGDIVHWRSAELHNQPGQTFDRVPTPEVRAQHTATHDLQVRPTGAAAPANLHDGPPASAAVDATLADASLFERHGIGRPWTRDDLIDVINTDIADLTPAQRSALTEIRNGLPQPQPGEWIQKVITPSQVDNYLHNVTSGTRGPATIGGTVSRAVDTVHLDTPAALHDGLRLDYPGTVFSPTDDSVHVIRFRTDNTTGFVTPRHSSIGGDGSFDGWSPPFTGNGFTGAHADVIPEYHGKARMLDGSEMWEITESGAQRLTAVLQGGEWVPVR